MKEDTKDVLMQFGEKLVNLLDKGVDVATEQVPLVLQEVLMWGLAYNLTGQLLMLLASAVFGLTVYKVRKGANYQLQLAKAYALNKGEDYRGYRTWHNTGLYEVKLRDGVPLIDWEESGIALQVCFTAISMCLAGLSFTFIDWLKIVVAPRLYLLEYASDLLK